MRRLQLAAATCLAGTLLLCSIAGCEKAPAAAVAEAPRVSVMHPEQRELADHEEFNGWMAADKSVEVRSRVRGHIKSVNFTDGQYVKKGDLLFELDPRPFQAEIGKAQDKVKVYEAQKVAADRDADRYRELVPQRAASQKELDKAVANADSLAAEVTAAGNEVDRAKLDLEYSRITADIDGRISKAEMTEGQFGQRGWQRPAAHDDRVGRSDPDLFQRRRTIVAAVREKHRREGRQSCRPVGQIERSEGKIQLCARWRNRLYARRRIAIW